jgi:hypothetical protein
VAACNSNQRIIESLFAGVLNSYFSKLRRGRGKIRLTGTGQYPSTYLREVLKAHIFGKADDEGPRLGALRNTQPVFLLSTEDWLVLVGAAARPLSKVPWHEIQRGFSFTTAFNRDCGGSVRSPLGNLLCADGLS